MIRLRINLISTELIVMKFVLRKLVILAACIVIANSCFADKKESASPIWEEIKKFKKDPKVAQQLKIKDPLVKQIAGAIDIVKLANSKKTWLDRTLSNIFFNVFPGGIIQSVSKDGLVLMNKEKAPLLFELIEDLCEKMQIPMPAIFLSGDKKMFNAFATSLSHNLSMVVIGQALVKKITTDEFRSLLAHELAHIQHSHVPKGLLQGLINMGLTAVFSYHLFKMISAPVDYRFDENMVTRSSQYQISDYAKRGAIFLGLMAAINLLCFESSIANEKEADMTSIDVTDAKSFVGMIEKIEEKILKDKRKFEEPCDLVLKQLEELSKESPKMSAYLKWRLNSHKKVMDNLFESIMNKECGTHPSITARKKYGAAMIDQSNACSEPAPTDEDLGVPAVAQGQ